MNTYEFDSISKQTVRDHWVQYLLEIKDGDETPLRLITLPSSELQELFLYMNHGLIEGKYDEKTGKLHVTNGDIYCFEKKHSKYMVLLDKLVGGTSRQDDVCSYIRTIRPKVLNHKKKVGLPLDGINLDFEGSLCKLKIPIEETVADVVACQAAHKKPFVLFLTFPNSEDTDSDEYKAKVQTVLSNNIQDPNNEKFREKFKEVLGDIDTADYEISHIVAVVKNIIKQTSNLNFECIKYDVFIYGDKDLVPGARKRMISMLFRFELKEDAPNHPVIYYQDILLAFKEAVYLADNQ